MRSHDGALAIALDATDRDAMRDAAPPNVDVRDLDLHINDAAFSDAVLAIFDNWRALGHVPPACAKA